MSEPDPGTALHARLMARLEVELVGHQHLWWVPLLKALQAVLVLHSPSPRKAHSINSLDCPEHDPRDWSRHLDTSWETAQACPNCVTSEYTICSARSCDSHGYPCETVDAIAETLKEA